MVIFFLSLLTLYPWKTPEGIPYRVLGKGTIDFQDEKIPSPWFLKEENAFYYFSYIQELIREKKWQKVLPMIRNILDHPSPSLLPYKRKLQKIIHRYFLEEKLLEITFSFYVYQGKYILKDYFWGFQLIFSQPFLIKRVSYYKKKNGIFYKIEKPFPIRIFAEHFPEKREIFPSQILPLWERRVKGRIRLIEKGKRRMQCEVEHIFFPEKKAPCLLFLYPQKSLFLTYTKQDFSIEIFP